MNTGAYRRIGYLQWARAHFDRVKYDLARPTVRPVTKEELGLTLDGVQLAKRIESDPLDIEALLAKKYGVEPQHLVLTTGAMMGVYAVLEAMLKKGDEVLIEVPNYEPIWTMLNRKSVTVKTFERLFEDHWQVDVAELQRRISRNTRAVILTNLHNPTGASIDVDKLTAIAQIARDYRALVVVDEALLDAALDPALKPGATLASNVISISSISKAYGLGGVRCGWVVCQSDELTESIRTIVNDYLLGRVPMPSMSIGALALSKADEILAKGRKLIEDNIKTVATWLSRRTDLAWVKPAGGTVAFIKLPGHIDDEKLSFHLIEKHDTLVVPGQFFWKKGFVRIALGCEGDTLKAGLRNVGAAVDELSR